jgi:hypothetical protein
MKKITLSIGLIISALSGQAQDTTCTYFTGKRVLEFDYYNDTILYEKVHNGKYYDIEITYGNTLCLDLSDESKFTVRTIITKFFDGSAQKDVLNSNDQVYYSPRGAVKVSVGKARIKLF